MTASRCGVVAMVTTALLVTTCSAQDCLLPVLDPATFFRPTPATSPHELTRVPATQYSQCVAQCCHHSDGMCNVVLFTPPDTEVVEQPNCIVYYCDTVRGCDVSSGSKRVQIFADAVTVLQAMASNVSSDKTSPTAREESETHITDRDGLQTPQPTQDPLASSSMPNEKMTHTPDEEVSGHLLITAAFDAGKNHPSTRLTVVEAESTVTGSTTSSPEGTSKKEPVGALPDSRNGFNVGFSSSPSVSVPDGGQQSASSSTPVATHPITSGPVGNTTSSVLRNESISQVHATVQNTASQSSSFSQSSDSQTEFTTQADTASQSPGILQVVSDPKSSIQQAGAASTENVPTPMSPDGSQQVTPPVEEGEAGTGRTKASPQKAGALATSDGGTATPTGTGQAQSRQPPVVGGGEVSDGEGEEETGDGGLADDGPVVFEDNGTSSAQDDRNAVSREALLTTATLVSALSIGCFFCLVASLLLGKRFSDSWKKRKYSRIERDYLIDGMYSE